MEEQVKRKVAKPEISFGNTAKPEISIGNASKPEVSTGHVSKPEVETMHRNKNYCPECGNKYSSESAAFCPQCGHPRKVKKTW